jgi:hypothetical protein
MEAFTISAKNLSALNMPGVCLCAYWHLLHMNFKKPWDIFPPIFNDFDRRQKRFVRLHIDKHGCPPASFGSFADSIRYVNVGRLQYWDQPTNITINAEPDDVFALKNEKLCVVDYKTARYSKGQDKLLPLYNAQLSTYCSLIEKLGRGQVAKAALIYFEPVTDDSDDDLLKAITKRGYNQTWLTTPVAIEIDRDKTSALLKVARKLRDMSVPPVCNENCRGDCARIAELYYLCRGVELMKIEAAKQNHDGQFHRYVRKRAQQELQDALVNLGVQDQNAELPAEFSLLDWWDWESGDDPTV